MSRKGLPAWTTLTSLSTFEIVYIRAPQMSLYLLRKVGTPNPLEAPQTVCRLQCHSLGRQLLGRKSIHKVYIYAFS